MSSPSNPAGTLAARAPTAAGTRAAPAISGAAGARGAPTRFPGAPRRSLAAALPSVVEFAWVAAAIVLLLPLFDRLAPLAAGRDERFQDRGIFVAGLPEPALPESCAAYADLAEARVRDALCATRSRLTRAIAPTTLPVVLAAKIERAARAFATPLHEAQVRAATLRRQAGEGELELRDDGDAVAAIEAEIAPFIERYRLSRSADAGPEPLRCAARLAEAALGARPASAAETRAADEAARANVVLLLAAALDGHPATAAIAGLAQLPRAAGSGMPACAGIVAALGASAALLADARQSLTNARKNEAMRELVPSAGTQWAAAMAIGYAFLLWSRRTRRPALGVSAALAVWAGAAWLARVPWPFAGSHDFVPARIDTALPGVPATFVLVLAAAALAVGIASLVPARAGASPLAPQSMSSRVGYAGLVLTTGLGWLLLIDLSLHAHAGNRYLALYHQGHLWLAMLALSVLLFMRRTLSRGFAWTLAVGGEAARRATRRLGRRGAAAPLGVSAVKTLPGITAIKALPSVTVGVVLVLLAAAGVLAFGLALAHLRQLTSELGRIWLIAGAAWFFFLRAGPMTERLARAGPAGLSLLRYAWPLLFVVGVLVGAMLVTQDMGPLLIAGYASGAFVAAAVAMWWHHRSGQVLVPFGVAALLFAGWIGLVTAALFQVGAYHGVTASRLESVSAPFASINDQLALVSWFQRAAPAEGFGVGAAPWCGFAPARACSGGVPAQIHSDYTFTALVGVFGPLLAFGVSIAVAVWLHRLIRHHGRVTRGEPRLVGTEARLGNDSQALLSWISVAWVTLTSCQLAVTVAGNLAVLPLTGVTFPFMSFGMTSLLVNVAFLALCLNVDLPARGSGG